MNSLIWNPIPWTGHSQFQLFEIHWRSLPILNMVLRILIYPLFAILSSDDKRLHIFVVFVSPEIPINGWRIRRNCQRMTIGCLISIFLLQSFCSRLPPPPPLSIVFPRAHTLAGEEDKQRHGKMLLGLEFPVKSVNDLKGFRYKAEIGRTRRSDQITSAWRSRSPNTPSYRPIRKTGTRSPFFGAPENNQIKGRIWKPIR